MSEFATAYPNSRKVLVDGPQGVRVPMREIALSGGEPPLRVYDTSGPQEHDVDGRAAEAARAVGRAAPAGRDAAGRHAAALRAQGRDHARDGVHRDPRRAAGRVRPRRSRARPRDHPGQHQPPRARADDHRPQLPGEDQREHRQLGRVLVDRGRSREAALGDALGRRHGDGSLDRQEHPRDARVDRPQLRRCRSARCRSIRRSRRSAAGPRISRGRSIATRSSSSASRASTTSPSTPACCCATSR